MPLDGERLIVEPTFPHAEALMSIGQKASEGDDEGWRLRNQWYSRHHRCDILIMEKDGRIDWGKLPAFHHISHDLSTLGCSQAWGIEQEGRAIELLGKMLRHHQFKQYLMTGMFMETSSRSGVTYLFRRLKPTVAIRPGRRPEDSMRVLCALCMHPIAYYAGSWAGAMCPTDDVIAHLSLMRGDEADARAEGISWVDPTEEDYRWARERGFPTSDMQGVWTVPGMGGPGKADIWGTTPQMAYRFLWNNLHTEPGTRWDDNPWVCAVSFICHHGNVDEVGHG